MSLVSIVIPVRYRADLTRVCLDSIKKYSDKDFELILVHEGTDASISDFKDEVDKYVQNVEPKGFAGAMNAGAKVATGKYLVFLNNDTVVTPGWLSSMTERFIKDPKLGLVSPDYTEMPEYQKTQKDKGKDFVYIDDPLSMKGVCFVTTRKVFDEIGGWDESFGMGGGDDNDFCLRIKKLGYNLAVDRKSYIYHAGSASFRELFDNDIKHSREFADQAFDRFKNKHNIGKKRVYVAVLSMGKNISRLSIALVKMSHDMRQSVKIQFHNNKPISHNRNSIVKSFLESDCDYLLMIDEDIVPLKNPLELVVLDKDVIGCVCPQIIGNEIGWMAMKKEENGEYSQAKGRGLAQVDAIGTGCILIARRVLERVKIPFEMVFKDGLRKKGEDLNFCDKAREQGFEVWINWDYLCSHYKTVDLLHILKMMEVQNGR